MVMTVPGDQGRSWSRGEEFNFNSGRRKSISALVTGRQCPSSVCQGKRMALSLSKEREREGVNGVAVSALALESMSSSARVCKCRCNELSC
ncbi:hypothetical protein XELAEV_18036757mg [Xenopus laevis]|uniref:Uncharacterized protein n=1 Tax=Xenopus laevis TaxID=8355 RepID=A0A974CB33_XENLA|nr:hypothetical protein XELAEV_18036757mg [Xenopus laevis]